MRLRPTGAAARRQPAKSTQHPLARRCASTQHTWRAAHAMKTEQVVTSEVQIWPGGASNVCEPSHDAVVCVHDFVGHRSHVSPIRPPRQLRRCLAWQQQRPDAQTAVE